MNNLSEEPNESEEEEETEQADEEHWKEKHIEKGCSRHH